MWLVILPQALVIRSNTGSDWGVFAVLERPSMPLDPAGSVFPCGVRYRFLWKTPNPATAPMADWTHMLEVSSLHRCLSS
jgi:hypothetical protein